MSAKKPVSLVYAIPDPPWVDATDGAAVRIAMTGTESGSASGLLATVVSEKEGEGYEVQLDSNQVKIHPVSSMGCI